MNKTRKAAPKKTSDAAKQNNQATIVERPGTWHLARTETERQLSDFEFRLERLAQAYYRWKAACLAAVCDVPLTGDDVAVLNGGFKKWTREGRPVATDDGAAPRRRFTARPRPELIADKSGVLGALADDRACVLNALTEEQHRGTGGATYGRRGRITGSTNVPARELVDPETHAYLPLDVLRAKFAAAGALDASRVVTYCGGGIAASSDAFVLVLLGHPNIALYDASLSEWAADPSLPMETG